MWQWIEPKTTEGGIISVVKLYFKVLNFPRVLLPVSFLSLALLYNISSVILIMIYRLFFTLRSVVYSNLACMNILCLWVNENWIKNLKRGDLKSWGFTQSHSNADFQNKVVNATWKNDRHFNSSNQTIRVGLIISPTCLAPIKISFYRCSCKKTKLGMCSGAYKSGAWLMDFIKPNVKHPQEPMCNYIPKELDFSQT